VTAAINDLLREIYATSKTTPRPEAVSIDPPPREAGWVCLVDAKGKPCAYMGFELAARLGWIEGLRHE